MAIMRDDVKLICGRHIILFCLIILTACTTYSQTYFFKNFNVQEGLTRSQVISIEQDDKGILWIGTMNGISKYDGFAFENINLKDGLPGNNIYSLYKDRKGKMWIGTNNGLCIYDKLKFKTVKSPFFDKNYIFSFYETNDTIWIASVNGVFIYTKSGYKEFLSDSEISGIRINSILKDSRNTMWFGTSKGVFSYKKNHLKKYTTKNGLNHDNVKTLCEDKKGNIWIGTNKGINQFVHNSSDHKCFIHFPQNYGIRITSSVRKDNVLWFGSNNGLIKCDLSGKDPKFTVLGKTNGLNYEYIWDIYTDFEGNLWVGTNGGGILKFGGEGFISLNKKNLIPDTDIWAIYKDSKNNIWIGTSDKGVLNIPQDKVSDLSTLMIHYSSQLEPLQDYHIWHISEDRKGNIWFGCIGGFFRFNGKILKFFPLPENEVFSIYEDHEGTLWLATLNGLITVEDERIISQYKIINKTVFNIYEDKSHAIWFSGYDGLYHYKNGKVTVYNKKTGFIDGQVFNVIQDQTGNYFISTATGLYLYDNHSFIPVNNDRGSLSHSFYSMILYDKNQLFLGTEQGIELFDPYVYHQTKQLSISHFGKSEGFLCSECFMNSSCTDHLGRIWFGTIEGIAIVAPKTIQRKFKETKITLEKIQLYFKDIDWDQYSEGIDSTSGLPLNISLPYDQNHLTFHFLGIHLTNPEKVRYRFKLEGHDKVWSPEVKENKYTYTNIPHGTFTFKVIACNSAGKWSRPTTFTFTILAPFYKKWWFYFFSVFLTISLFYLVYMIRISSLQKAKMKLEQEVEERTKELKTTNMELISQKNIVEAKNKDITDSINYARTIQTSLLMSEEQVKLLFPESYVFFRPRDIVSGDFFWASRKNDHVFIAAADCTGHGVPGAFMSILGNSLLNEIVIDKRISEPDEILNHLKIRVIEALQNNKKDFISQDGMDIAICSIDSNNLLHFAGANNPLYLVRNNELIVLPADKTPIGYTFFSEDHKFKKHTVSLEKEDTLYLFSDGYIDQFGMSKKTAASDPIETAVFPKKKFSTKRFKNLLLSLQNHEFSKHKELIGKALEDWKGNYDQLDDIMIIGIRF